MKTEDLCSRTEDKKKKRKKKKKDKVNFSRNLPEKLWDRVFAAKRPDRKWKFGWLIKICENGAKMDEFCFYSFSNWQGECLSFPIYEICGVIGSLSAVRQAAIRNSSELLGEPWMLCVVKIILDLFLELLCFMSWIYEQMEQPSKRAFWLSQLHALNLTFASSAS